MRTTINGCVFDNVQLYTRMYVYLIMCRTESYVMKNNDTRYETGNMKHY